MDDELFTVTVTYQVFAKDRKEAAQKAAVLTHQTIPTEFQVKDAAAISKDVVLTEDEIQQALDRDFKGELFPSLEEHQRKMLG